MENYSVVIFILAIMITISALAEKIRLSYPILLVAVGIVLGFIPSMPEVVLDPDVIFLIFLPPLLYDAAFNISYQSFKTHINTISTLAVGLVFITTVVIAVISYYVIPGMTWPLSFVLGSILSATDAVAAISITKGLNLSHNTITILEGESLVNDASALVAYRFAVSAVTGTAFIFWKASITFLILIGGGLLVGYVMGKLLALLLRWVRGNSLANISFTILMPFVTYRMAEELNVSGVIAVVILGLSMSRLSKTYFPDNLKQQSRSFWDVVIFILNGLIFILMGLEFPYVLRNIDHQEVLPYIGYAFLITIAALVLRLARVFLQKINLQRAFLGRKARITREALLDFQSSLIIGWSGMRGIVSLAIALGLDNTIDNGEPFPMRHAIIFISVVVVLFTLLGQGLSLPWIVKRLNKRQQLP